MNLSHSGDIFWAEWDGEDFEPEDPEAVVYYTEGHVTFEYDWIRRSVVTAIQRDGLAEYSTATKALEDVEPIRGWSGYIAGDSIPWQCDESGETFYGDIVDRPRPTTWVEFRIGD